jgi:hypothetical protein
MEIFERICHNLSAKQVYIIVKRALRGADLWL